MNAKISQKYDNVHHIRKNYALKSIYDDENNALMTHFQVLNLIIN